MKVFSIFAVLLVGSINLIMPHAYAEIRVVEPKSPASLPKFSLRTHKDEAFTEENYKGGWTLTTIGFTHCPDVCPFVLNNLAEVVSQMSVRVRPDRLPRVVFVAVDPARDAEVLGEYVKHFNPNFVGVTGMPEELGKLVEGMDGFYRIGKPGKGGAYDVQHSASVILTGPNGQIRAKLSPPLAPGEVAEYLTRKQIAFIREKRNAE